MKKIKHIILGVIVISMSSCVSLVVGPATASQVLVTKNPIGPKVGVIEQTVWLGLFSDACGYEYYRSGKKG